MKKQSGFTLIELLAVITILIALALVISPIVIDKYEEAKKVASNQQINAFINLSKIYMNQNMEKLPAENKIYAITYDELKNANLSNTNQILDPKTNKPISGCITVRYENNKYTYTYTEQKICSLFSMLVTSGDGLYESTEPGRFIYKGANPNNYIWLDEDGDNVKQSTEIYRIISYESAGTIKVIRDTSIGNMPWDERTDTTTGPRHNTNNTYCNYTGTYYGCNVWGTQESTYYNDTTLTNLNQDFLYKYYPNNTSPIQNYTNTGTVTQNSSLNNYLNNEWTTKQNLDDYISNHSFNVGGIYYYSTYPASEAKTLSQEKEEQNIYTWNGKIGLMNITDYVEASLNPTCTSVYSNYYYNSNYYYDSNGDGTKEQTISGYDNWPCSNRSYNWMAKAITEWSLSPNSYYRYNVWNVSSSGNFYNNYANSTIGVRPVFYLKSDITLTGTGTINDPYTISK